MANRYDISGVGSSLEIGKAGPTLSASGARLDINGMDSASLIADPFIPTMVGGSPTITMYGIDIDGPGDRV